MIEASLAFLVGLAVLLKGSDLFVASSVKIAKYVGLSEIVIGLTLVAVGTSLPELASSIAAASSGDTELVVGNVVGSNIANIGLILGLTAVIGVLKISEELFYRDAFILLGLSFVFYWFAADGVVSSVEGVILLAVFFAYVAYLFKVKPRFGRILRLGEYIYERFPVDRIFEFRLYKRIVEKGLDMKTYRELFDRGVILGLPERAIKKGLDPATYRRLLVAYEGKIRKEIVQEFVVAMLGLAAVYYGSKYLVSGAVELALLLGVSQNIIGLTFVAVGTSLPEFMVSITSVRKGYGNIVLGNVIGSNIANISLVAGASTLVRPLAIPPNALAYTIPFMILISVMCMFFIRSGWKVQRMEGVVFLASYALVIAWAVHMA